MNTFGGIYNSVHALEIAKGNVLGHTPLYKFGHNDAVGTNEEDLWGGGDLYTYPTSNTTMTLSSSSTVDDEGSTGAFTVDTLYLSDDFVEQTATTTLDGRNGVTVATDIYRPYRMIVRSAGSGGTNAGTIYLGTGSLTAGVPANIFAEIEIGKGQTLMALYTVPVGKTAYIWGWEASPVGQLASTINLYIRPIGEVFQIQDEMHVFQDIGTHGPKLPRKVNAKSDIALRGKVAAGSAAMGAYIDMVVIDD